MLLSLKNKIPEFLKRPVRHLQNKWNFRVDKKILSNLEEYFDLDRRNILRLLETSDHLNSDFWLAMNPKSEEEIKNFYKQTPFYIFNLTFWHARKDQLKLRPAIIGLARGKVLDFGGGIGDMSLMAKKRGLDVDYADIAGKTFNFAKWLFDKENCDIPMIDLGNNKIRKKYDTIFCIDVIEHVPEPQKIMKELVKHLNKGGQMFITALNIASDKNNPTHLDFNFDAKEYLKSLGMAESKNPNLWLKVR